MQHHVESLLREAELEAERIVSVARIAVALGLLMFFVATVSPPDSIPEGLAVRMWVFAVAIMVLYLALGVLTWVTVRRRWFRRWMVLPTAVLDVVFVVAALRSSMLNADIGGAALFAFPAVWLVPMILGFGILRGDPAAMAAMAVSLLGGLAWLASMPASGTGDDSQRAAELFLSGGPNTMRLAMITLAGGVLTLAAWRARGLLQGALETTLRNANLTRYLPAALAPQLATGQLETLRQGRREELAVLFIDIRGFTAMSEAISESALSEFITDFRHHVAQVVTRHGGMIDKFIGDAAMVVFSDHAYPARAAANALKCAIDLQEAIHDWSDWRQGEGKPPVNVGVGVHFGSVFAGVVGDETRLEYSVFGDTVNVAARLEQLTKELGHPVLASRATVVAAGASGWQEVARRPVRGREGEIEIMAPVPSG